MSPSASIPFEYRQPIWGQVDRALKNCYRVAATLGVLVLVTVFVMPRPAEEELSFEEVPERFARLIVEKPQPPATAPATSEPVAQLDTPRVEEPARVEAKVPEALPKPSPRRRNGTKPVDPDAGRKGREVATAQVTRNLENVQGSLDQALENLSAALPAAESGSSSEGTRRRRSRNVRGGKSRSDIGGVGGVQTTDAGSVSGAGLASNGITISGIADLGGEGTGGAAAGGSADGVGQGSGGEVRSNASLLAVVRRYAAGIQFCYDNQLKKQPGLRGKLVVSLTVLADGSVSEALVVQDGLRSGAVVDCVLAQIRTWKFPAIETGVVSFKTPFVFTPPE